MSSGCGLGAGDGGRQERGEAVGEGTFTHAEPGAARTWLEMNDGD